MAVVLAEKLVGITSQLWAYLHWMVHAARNYQESEWVAYVLIDCIVARPLLRAALNWTPKKSTLYNEAFVGRAKDIARL